MNEALRRAAAAHLKARRSEFATTGVDPGCPWCCSAPKVLSP